MSDDKNQAVVKNYPTLHSAWVNLAKMQDIWTSGTGKFLIEVLIHHFGRQDAEDIALYWHEQGRDDIAARVKAAIHEATP